jgi:hypothetical protein
MNNVFGVTSLKKSTNSRSQTPSHIFSSESFMILDFTFSQCHKRIPETGKFIKQRTLFLTVNGREYLRLENL